MILVISLLSVGWSCRAMKLFVFVFFFGLVSGRGNEDLRILDLIMNEADCLSAGGMCTVAADCPRNQLADRGLCPRQAMKGVECCHGISVKETRCAKRGGACFEKKNTNCNIIAREATDCEEDSVCCILV